MQLDMLNRELVKTTQRINLYEKVLIPQCKENIRRIKVYLGDQQTAAVCRAKIAKAKLVAKAELETVSASAGGVG
jgi:V/A-type H+-transporting ATPase subunit D